MGWKSSGGGSSYSPDNKTTLDKLSEANGRPTFSGQNLAFLSDAGGGSLALPAGAGTAVVMGDSISQSGSDDSTGFMRPSWFNIACIKSNQRLLYVKNSAIAGQRTDNMVARFDTDVIAYHPRYCFIMGGTNDLSSGLNGIPAGSTPETLRANIDWMVTRCKDNNIIPILCTIPPRDDNTIPNIYTLTNSYNLWLKKYGAKNGVMVIDMYSIIVDPATGKYKTGFGVDGIHPNYNGLTLMGDLVVAQMNSILPAYGPYLSYSNIDPINMLTNGCFTGTVTNGVPAGWTANNTAVVTNTVVTDAVAVGSMARIQKAGSGIGSLAQTISTGFSVGDKIMFAGKIKTISLNDLSLSHDVTLTFDGSTGPVKLQPIAQFQNNINNGGTWFGQFTVPAGTTSMTVSLNLNAGDGTVQYGQVTVVNLTTQEADL
jgi:lysophospholipase L1-like esterase